jgi:hypothetical protein
MNRELVSRRSLLSSALSIAAVGTAADSLLACSKSAPLCSDPAHLTDAENSLRTSLNYQEHSGQDGQACAGCAFFQADKDSLCGTCKLLKGPVNPLGRCDSWSAAHK